jgi:hypothetical protein
MGPLSLLLLINCSILGVYLVTFSFTQASECTGVGRLLSRLKTLFMCEKICSHIYSYKLTQKPKVEQI